jgi:Zn-dependent protease with chaperone function
VDAGAEPRPNALALPSPTSSQFAVFIAALLTAGTFVGSWVHNVVVGDQWYRTVSRCYAPSLGGGGGFDRQVAAEQGALRCSASAERRLAVVEIAGVGAVAVLAVALLAVAPAVLERRRRLRPPGERLAPAAQRLDALAGEAGLTRPPALMLGPATQRDAFSYGLPGRYRIALPPAVAVRWRDASLFDPLVRHELAHVRHRDVALAWLARVSWYALAFLLAVPIVGALVEGDASLLPSYVWRAALLGVTAQVVASALLRSRELSADLWAARAGGGEAPVAGVLARARDVGARAPWRRALARHPSPAERLAVLERPERSAAVGFADGFAPAFLAGLSLPVLASIVRTLLTGNTQSSAYGSVAAVVLAAPVLAGSVGLGLGRAVLLERVAGGTVRPALPALGVAAGLIAGQLASLANTGAGGLSDIAPPLWLAGMAALGFGGTLLAAGFAEVWADAAPALPGPRAAWIGLVAVQALLFAAVLWLCTTLETPARAGGVIVRAWLVFSLNTTLIILAVAVGALTVAWALTAARRARVTPGWLLERGAARPWAAGRGLREPLTCGLAAGAVGGLALVLYRIADGPAKTDAKAFDRLYLVIWLGALSAAAAAAVLALLRPRRGPGAALLAGPVACVVAVAIFVAENTIRGGGLSYAFVKSVLLPPLALGLLCVTCAATLSLLPRPRVTLPVWRSGLALAAVIAAVLIGARGSLFPPADLRTAAAGALSGSRGALGGTIDEPRNYLTVVGTDMIRRYSLLQTALTQVATPGAASEAQIRTLVEAPGRKLLADEQAAPVGGRVAPVHATCVQAIAAAVTEADALASAAGARAVGDANALRLALARALAASRTTGRLSDACTAGLQRLLQD